MDERIYLMDLYDLYEKLLNDKQREYFKCYYFDNLSLGEISELLNVSRNAVHKNIKLVDNKLKDYESKLNLYEKNITLEKVINTIEDNKLKRELEKLRW
ncbi:MAG TPA: sigma factor-like helix-turn-helix DNA-binding protein [Bacilli bacterium]|nr:sigma factor-like helix-turn-helix DNA-binding protein [Bacilli bacterium]